jgi:hypothetical protein
VSLTTGVTGTLPIANGGTGQTTQTAAFDALAPTTTQGDIIYHNGTDNVRLARGSDGQALVLASNVPSWANVATDPTTVRGQMLRRGAAALEAFTASTNNRVVRGDGTDAVLGQIDNPAFFTTGAAATEAAIGIVTTSAQNIAGLKTFYDGIELDDDADQDTLNYYREDTYTTTFAGNLGGLASSSFTIRITRIGRMVTLEVPQCTNAGSASSSTSLVAASAAPAWARPAVSPFQVGSIFNNNALEDTPGAYNITTAGIITVYRRITGTTAFTNSNQTGFTAFTLTYSV